jgi:hypothetical protein
MMTKAGGPGSAGGKKYRGSTIPADLRSLARTYTREAMMAIAAIMRTESNPAAARLTAAGMLLDRGWGKSSETHHIDVNGDTSMLKVVNEIVHVHETREQVEFRDQVPLLELAPEDTKGNGSKSTH